jgi:hypothetical protein
MALKWHVRKSTRKEELLCILSGLTLITAGRRHKPYTAKLACAYGYAGAKYTVSVICLQTWEQPRTKLAEAQEAQKAAEADLAVREEAAMTEEAAADAIAEKVAAVAVTTEAAAAAEEDNNQVRKVFKIKQSCYNRNGRSTEGCRKAG